MKICLVIPVVLIAIVSFVIGQEVEPEEPCTKLGGVCAKGCEHSPYEQGLCPKQQKDGVQCCYHLEEKQCRSFGGECGDNCPKIGRNDLGCPTGKSCCIWRRK